jgi:hypothetical protein
MTTSPIPKQYKTITWSQPSHPQLDSQQHQHPMDANPLRELRNHLS